LKQNRVITLSEPYFKVGANGQYAIRVDHPTDIIWLSEGDPKAPEKWRTKAFGEAKPAEYWKENGKDLVNTGKFYGAIEMLDPMKGGQI
jgi:hypothetical protein